MELQTREPLKTRIIREYNEHLKGNFLGFVLVMSVLLFMLGYAWGWTQATATIGRIGYNILEKYADSEQIKGLIKQCIFEFGYG